MAEKHASEIVSLTHEVELDFEHLFEARKFKRTGEVEGKGEAKFDAMFVFDADHPDIDHIRKVCGTLARQEFGSDVSFADVRFPVVAGDKVIERANRNAEKNNKAAPNNDHLRGKLTITARSLFAPRLCVLHPSRGMVDYKDEARLTVKDKFFNGARVIAEFNFVANEVDEKLYVTAYLNVVGSLGKGERRGGGKSGNDTFAGYVGRVSAVDPTAGQRATLDQEIPF